MALYVSRPQQVEAIQWTGDNFDELDAALLNMAALLDPEQELETIEVGDRVAWDFTMMLGVTIYHREEDRVRSCVLMMLGQVCERLRGAHGIKDVTAILPPGWTPADLLAELGAGK